MYSLEIVMKWAKEAIIQGHETSRRRSQFGCQKPNKLPNLWAEASVHTKKNTQCRNTLIDYFYAQLCLHHVAMRGRDGIYGRQSRENVRARGRQIFDYSYLYSIVHSKGHGKARSSTLSMSFIFFIQFCLYTLMHEKKAKALTIPHISVYRCVLFLFLARRESNHGGESRPMGGMSTNRDKMPWRDDL